MRKNKWFRARFLKAPALQESRLDLPFKSQRPGIRRILSRRVTWSQSSLKSLHIQACRVYITFPFLLEHLSSLEILEQALSLISIQPESGSRIQLASYWNAGGLCNSVAKITKTNHSQGRAIIRNRFYCHGNQQIMPSPVIFILQKERKRSERERRERESEREKEKEKEKQRKQ